MSKKNLLSGASRNALYANGGDAVPDAGPAADEQFIPAVRTAPGGRSLETSLPEDVCMEQLLDKLKLLNYEKDICRRKRPYRKPLTSVYFAVQPPHASKTEAYLYFASVVAWMLQQLSVEFATPKEHDDPNATCAAMLAATRKLGFAPPSYASIKLTHGYGREVLGLLDGLAELMLERRGAAFPRPIVHPPDGYQDADGGDGGIEDDDDMAGNDLAEEVAPEEEEEEQAYMQDVRDQQQPGTSGSESAADKQVLESKVDPLLWKLELERVAPRLRIVVGPDGRDWRGHVSQVEASQGQLQAGWSEGRAQLERTAKEVGDHLDKLQTRERLLNQQCGGLLLQYRAAREQLQQEQELHDAHAQGVSERNNELHRLVEQLEQIKQMLDERGSNLSDATPVVRTKTAIKKLTEEVPDMEVRIGVLSHRLMHLNLRNRQKLHQAAVVDDLPDVY